MGRAVSMFVGELRLRAVGKVSCTSSVGACELVRRRKQRTVQSRRLLRLPVVLPQSWVLAEVDRPFDDKLQRPSAAILGRWGWHLPIWDD